MKIKAILSLAVAILVLIGCEAKGQQSGGLNINELHRQIQELQAVERDETASAEVRAINRRFISERRAQLRVLLQKRIDALQKYQSSLNSVLTLDEKKQIQDTIGEFQQELQNLDQATPESPVSTAAAGSSADSDSKPNRAEASPAVEAEKASSVNLTSSRARETLSPTDTDAAQTAQKKKSEAEKVNDDIATGIKTLARKVKEGISGKTGAARDQAVRDVIDPTEGPVLYGMILSKNVLPRERFTADIEEARVDEQVGGGSSSAGSTSLVSKGSIPAILGFAVENGGLTRTDDGTTITFRGNPVGLFESLGGQGFISSYDDDSPFTRQLRKLTFGVLFDTSLGDLPGTFTAKKQQLAGYSFRYEFKNERDPRNKRYAERWAALVRNNGQAVARTANVIQNLFDRDTVLKNWQIAAQTAIIQAVNKGDDVDKVVEEQFEILKNLKLSPAADLAVTNFSTAFLEYRSQRSKLLEIIDNGPLFTFEYTNERHPGLIDTSRLNLIYEMGALDGRLDLSFNGSATLFNSKPATGMKRLRAFDFSAQLDAPFGNRENPNKIIFSAAAQYKRIAENDTTASGSATMDNKGDIATGNLKLTIPVKGLGLKIPLSLTFANRTEFSKKSQVRGNIGITFDPDSIFALFNPFSQK